MKIKQKREDNEEQISISRLFIRFMIVNGDTTV